MSYIQGFVVAVPAANKEAYRAHAAKAAPLFKEYGASRVVECWGDDVPEGEVTDFRRATLAKDDEVVVLSWMEFSSKAVADAATKRMFDDPRMEELGEMPFDGKRMLIGGFTTLLDE
mgnify:CR=1 FL=1